MEISTIHSFAYKKMKKINFNLCFELKQSIIIKLLKQIEEKINSNKKIYLNLEYIEILKDFVNFYCNSSIIEINKHLLNTYKKKSKFTLKFIKLINENETIILMHLKYILSSMKNKTIDCIHDFYLKLFYITYKNKNFTFPYDLILIDEAQDISDVMLAITELFKCNRIFVGDCFQQIYSFRYTNNILKNINLPEYKLSHSFRFSNSYAFFLKKKLNYYYKKYSNDKLELYGNNDYTCFNKNCIDTTKQFAIISRTTFGLLNQTIDYLHKEDIKFYFEGGINGYSFMNQLVWSIFYLKENKKDKITNEEIKKFKDFNSLCDFSKKIKKQDYLNTIKIIKKFGKNIFNINKEIKKKITNNKKEADIIFTTTHKAKGLEYNQVILCEDFIMKKDIAEYEKNSNFSKILEEINIFYVALTRAKNAISLNYYKEN